MKDWETLTEQGRLRRLRPLAATALAAYDIVPRRIRLVGGFDNAIWRIDTDGPTYALRVDYLQDHTDEDVLVEIAWLEALAAETDLDVVRPVRSSADEPFVYAEAPGVPGARLCALFEWVPGRQIAERLTPDVYRRLGVLSASLHIHGSGFVPPHQPMAWDRVFYWPEDVDPVVFRDAEHAHVFGGGRMDTLERTITSTTGAFARLDPDEWQVIHADLHPWNVHAYHSRLIALDFNDVAWGQRVQDVAITLSYERDHPQYRDLAHAFRTGYETVSRWPESEPGQIEHFVAARTVMFINFFLNIDDDPTNYYARAFPRLETYLERHAS